jgi:hypothetical protein
MAKVIFSTHESSNWKSIHNLHAYALFNSLVGIRLLEFLRTTTTSKSEGKKSNLKWKINSSCEFDHNKNSSMRFISMYFISHSAKIIIIFLPLNALIVIWINIVEWNYYHHHYYYAFSSLLLCFIIDFDTHAHTHTLTTF